MVGEEGRLHSFDRQSGAIAWLTTSLPLEQTQRRSNRVLFPMSLLLSPGSKTPLKKLVFDDPDADSSVTI